MPINCAPPLSDQKSRSCFWSLFMAASLVCSVYFIGSAYLAKDFKQRLFRSDITDPIQKSKSTECKNQCKPRATEALPEGIISKTSDLKMQPLWSYDLEKATQKPLMSLLAIAVGIQQKEVVDQIVRKFPASDFIVMLFHYDEVVDEWKNLTWNHQVIHVSAENQTKWWFAKRFLHPDIVAEYEYIFLWDEDLGVENFHPKRYLSIVKEEGLEISQPALDPVKSAVYHPITARSNKSRVHRRMYKSNGKNRCDDHNTAPPCIGWVELMAPVFSKAAWRCTWYMIQNDMIHAWGLDLQLGYCAQGDRMKKVGVVDAEYIVHLALPTLGGIRNEAPSDANKVDNRPEVRRQSFIEMQKFKKRWKTAAKEDRCWVDPYKLPTNQTIH